VHRCGAKFDTLVEHDAHAAGCGPWAEAAPVQVSTSELAKRALAVVRGNRKILRRIMNNEMLYRGDL
jgi:hypothetical protein